MNKMRFWTGTLGTSAACGLVILATAPGYQIGGAGRVLVQALQGHKPPELTIEYQLERTPGYALAQAGLKRMQAGGAS